MRTPEVGSTGSRETRLLLVTIAISVGVLLLLARFRFPEEVASQTVTSAPAPLERLAARAAYDELASIMADLERRVTPRVTVVRLQSSEGSTSSVLAPRLLPDRAVALVQPAGGAVTARGGDHEVIDADHASGLVVMRVPAIDDSAVLTRAGLTRTGPRYVGVVEASALGPVIRPLYIGRLDTTEDARTGTPLYTFAGHREALRPGSAIFSLEGTFIGLIRDAGDPVTVIPAEHLRNVAQAAQQTSDPARGDLGIEVGSLTEALVRATGAEQGAIVVHVHAGGPAGDVLRSGDVIQSIDGIAITGPAAFREAERSRQPGAAVAVTAVRGRAPLQLTIKAGDLEAAAPTASDPGLVGRNVPDVGIEVVAVREGSEAERAGLRRGDLIVALEGVKSPDVAALTRRFRAEPPAPALVTVQRQGEHRLLVLERR